MIWLRRKPEPELVKVHVPSLTDCGHTVAAVPADVVPHMNAFHKRIADLNEENDALVESARVMANAQQARIDGQADIIAGLNKALAVKQGELDRALAEVKRLHTALAQVDCENLRLGGLLATAEEQIAGLKLGVM